MLNYNIRVFEIFQSHINIIKNIRINFTFLTSQFETMKQFIVDCMFREILQNIKIVIVDARNFTNKSRNEKMKKKFFIRIHNNFFRLSRIFVNTIWLLNLISITLNINCFNDFYIFVRRFEFLFQKMFKIDFSSIFFKLNFLFVLINRFIKHFDSSLNLKIKFIFKTRSTWISKHLKMNVFIMNFDFSKINTKNFVYEKTLQLNSRFMTRISYINIFYENCYHIERFESIFKMHVHRKAFFAQVLSSHDF